MQSISLKYRIGFSLIAVLLSVAFFHFSDHTNVVDLVMKKDQPSKFAAAVRPQIINTWNALENVTASRAPTVNKIAIGYNTNLDLIIHRSEEFFALFPKTEGPGQNAENVQTEEDFVGLFKLYFGRGAAAERFVANATLWYQILDTAEKYEHKSYAIGGNAGLMAEHMAQSGVKVLLGGVVGEKLATMFNSTIKLAGHRLWEFDEVHMIFEYARGSKFDDVVSPRANRFIVSRDASNSEIGALDNFHQSLDQFGPKAIIVSGLHLMESLPKKHFEERLRDVVQDLNIVLSHIPIHLELASVGNVAYLRTLARWVLPEVDSLGLNEEELLATYLSLGGTPFDKWPTPENVMKAMDHLFTQTPKGYNRAVQRIHFHYLHYHMIGLRSDDTRNPDWRSSDQASRAGVAAGSTSATRVACQDNQREVDLSLVTLLMNETFTVHNAVPLYRTGIEVQGTDNQKDAQFNVQMGVMSWRGLERNHVYHLAPVLVCKVPKRTVGLGDVISSTAARWIR